MFVCLFVCREWGGRENGVSLTCRLLKLIPKSNACARAFKDDVSVQAYLKGPIVAAVAKNPALSNVEAKVFDVLEKHSKITRGPVD